MLCELYNSSISTALSAPRRNEDKPGAISEVLAILSRETVNVASLNMARDASSLQAQCFIFLDDDISDGALSALRGLSTLKNVARIRLA